MVPRVRVQKGTGAQPEQCEAFPPSLPSFRPYLSWAELQEASSLQQAGGQEALGKHTVKEYF